MVLYLCLLKTPRMKLLEMKRSPLAKECGIFVIRVRILSTQVLVQSQSCPETKSCPMVGNFALAHCSDTGTTHVYSQERAGTSHRTPRSVRM